MFSSNNDDPTKRIFRRNNIEMMIPTVIHGYKLVKLLRETQMSCVFSLTTEEYVMKCTSSNYFEANKDEIKMLTEINHPNIIQAVKIYNVPDPNPRFAAILLPKARSDLHDHIVANKCLPERIICKIIFDIAQGLSYLHEKGIWHRDIKPENILVMDVKNGVPSVTIGDLGFAHEFGQGFFTSEAKGTIPYAAPELLELDESKIFGLRFKERARYCNNVDIFALGVIMFYLLSGEHPFGDNRHYDTHRHMTGEVIFNATPFIFVSNEAKRLIQEMLCPDPYSRPSIKDLLNNQWFSMLDTSSKPPLVGIYDRLEDEAIRISLEDVL